jgi:hypothetical protein
MKAIFEGFVDRHEIVSSALGKVSKLWRGLYCIMAVIRDALS